MGCQGYSADASRRNHKPTYFGEIWRYPHGTTSAERGAQAKIADFPSVLICMHATLCGL